jgi:hypothetical protein
MTRFVVVGSSFGILEEIVDPTNGLKLEFGIVGGILVGVIFPCLLVICLAEFGGRAIFGDLQDI